jgi:hypothetical protein
MTYVLASQNFTLEPSAVVMNLPSWLTSALVTGALVSRVWTIFSLLTSHNLLNTKVVIQDALYYIKKHLDV